MGKRQINENSRYFFVAAFFGALVSAYSNCSDVNIQQGHNKSSSVTPSGGVQKGEYDDCPKTNFYKTDSFFPRSSGGSTQEFGAMVDGATLVIKFTVPQDAGSYGEIRGSSIDSGTQNRTYSISKTACDFSQEAAVSYVSMPNTKKQKTVWLWYQDWGLGDEVSFDFPIGNEGENVPIIRGQTYYLNIRGNYGCDNPNLGECPLTRWTSKF